MVQIYTGGKVGHSWWVI